MAKRNVISANCIYKIAATKTLKQLTLIELIACKKFLSFSAIDRAFDRANIASDPHLSWLKVI